MLKETRKFTLRLPVELYSLIEKNMYATGITMNKEVIKALTTHYRVQPELERRIFELERINEYLLSKTATTDETVSNHT